MVKMVVEMENYILSCSQEAMPAQQWIAPQRHCSSLTSPSTASLILAMQALLLHTQPGFWQETELKPYCFNSNNGVRSSLFPFLNNPLPNLSQCSKVQRCVSHRHRKEADTEAAKRGSQAPALTCSCECNAQETSWPCTVLCPSWEQGFNQK